MIENLICMKQLSLLGVIHNTLFVRTLILKLTTLDILSKFQSLVKVLSDARPSRMRTVAGSILTSGKTFVRGDLVLKQNIRPFSPFR